jgi:hypothetical protein
MRRATGLGAFYLLLGGFLGCGAGRSQPSPPSTPADERGTLFQPDTAGTIRGRVTWAGPLPHVEPFEITSNPESSPVLRGVRWRANPNAPGIDPHSGGVVGAVVFLREVDPKRARPWTHLRPRVEIRGGEFHVMQGADTRIGFVRRGDAVEMVSGDAECHSLHCDGAAFFTLTFPDPDQPLSRTFPHEGVVELTSNSGFFWMRAYLFVSDHPYLTRTDVEGNFELRDVPPGSYDVVAWLPNWNVVGRDRDPESGFHSRLRFATPGTVAHKVVLEPHGVVPLMLQFTPESFR